VFQPRTHSQFGAIVGLVAGTVKTGKTLALHENTYPRLRTELELLILLAMKPEDAGDGLCIPNLVFHHHGNSLAQWNEA
jgi:hypothetical protein